jgi:cyclohexa-1,5-dienecarbonyl-CoA hydratase
MRASTPTFAKLQCELKAPASRIVLANPPLNVIDVPMMQELIAALEEVQQRDDIALVIFSGTGQSFSAGVDVKAHTPDKVRNMLVTFHSALRSIANLKKVTIASVRGSCLGGGAELAALCDIVYTSESATWGFPEITLGCFPPVAAVVLSAIIGQKRAADLILTGRTIGGREAVAFGLANEAASDAQLDDLVNETVERLGALSPAALAMTKKALYAWDSIHFEKGLDRAEKIYLEELMRTADANEGVQAFIEKRQPKWTGK